MTVLVGSPRREVRFNRAACLSLHVMYQVGVKVRDARTDHVLCFGQIMDDIWKEALRDKTHMLHEGRAWLQITDEVKTPTVPAMLLSCFSRHCDSLSSLGYTHPWLLLIGPNLTLPSNHKE